MIVIVAIASTLIGALIGALFITAKYRRIQDQTIDFYEQKATKDWHRAFEAGWTSALASPTAVKARYENIFLSQSE